MRISDWSSDVCSSDLLIGAGANILGNIEIGEGAKIGAGSVVLIPVPAHCTAAGVPAKLLGDCGCDQPAREMDHALPKTADDLQEIGRAACRERVGQYG